MAQVCRLHLVELQALSPLIWTGTSFLVGVKMASANVFSLVSFLSLNGTNGDYMPELAAAYLYAIEMKINIFEVGFFLGGRVGSSKLEGVFHFKRQSSFLFFAFLNNVPDIFLQV